MESLARDLREMQRIPLHDSHIDALRRAGKIRDYPAGRMIGTPGQAMSEFLYVEAGEIEVVDPATGGRRLPHTLGPGQFVGEISFLTGGSYTLPMRACADTRCIAVPRVRMLELMSAIPEMSDIVITVFAARRRRQIEDGDTALKLIGADVDRAVARIAQFAARNRIPVQLMDLRSDAAEAERSVCALDGCRPAVTYGGQVINNPTPQSVARLLGLEMDLAGDEVFDVVIVGGGPAGVAAGVYAGAEGLCALVIEDTAIGGQAGTSSRIENYMGFPTGISGGDLVWRGEIQAMKFGTRFAMPRRVAGLARRDAGFCLSLDDGEVVCARAVVVATGVQYRKLGLEGLERFEGAGIYYAATDMEARWCRDTEAVVVGGGNSAGQAAMFLSRTARHVHVLVRSDSLASSMSDYLSRRLLEDPAITVHFGHELSALKGDDRLDGVGIDGPDGTWHLDTRAVFLMVGAAPNTGWLAGHADLDPRGFVRTGRDAGGGSTFETSTPGVFAVGDVRAGSVKRVASSVGEGSVVISAVWDHVARMADKAILAE